MGTVRNHRCVCTRLVWLIVGQARAAERVTGRIATLSGVRRRSGESFAVTDINGPSGTEGVLDLGEGPRLATPAHINSDMGSSTTSICPHTTTSARLGRTI